MIDEFINNVIKTASSVSLNHATTCARRCLLDYLGTVLGGARLFSEKESNFVQSFGTSNDGCTLFGNVQKISAQDAALLNGISAHALELDDGHRVGMLHLGAPIISASIAVAEKEKVSANDFMLGIVVGYEAAIRLACAIQPDCKLKGYHATGVCGTIGVAMAVAKMLHFDSEQMKSAFSAAVTSSAGVLEMIEGDTELKPYNVGRAALDGVVSAYIGKARFKAPEDALGGKRGFLKVFSNEPKVQYLNDFSGGHFMIEQIYQKPYAACRHCHAPIEAALRIRELGVDFHNVDKIEVETYKLAVEGHDHTSIVGINSAKMSIPYSVAAALTLGYADINAFEEKNVVNSDILSLAAKIHVSERNDFSTLCPQKRIALVRVFTKNGEVIERQVDYPKGEPENPMTDDDLKQKFMSLAMSAGVKSETCEYVMQQVLDSDFSIGEIVSALNKEVLC